MAQSQQMSLEEELGPQEYEICLILHRLWWQARQRRLAHLAAAESATAKASA